MSDSEYKMWNSLDYQKYSNYCTAGYQAGSNQRYHNTSEDKDKNLITDVTHGSDNNKQSLSDKIIHQYLFWAAKTFNTITMYVNTTSDYTNKTVAK